MVPVTAVSTGQLTSDEAQCVIAAVQLTFSSIISETVELCGEPLPNDMMTCNGVIGLLSLVGGVDWAMMVHLPEATAPALAERFTGFAIPFDSEDMGDTIGELGNLLAGEMKVELHGIGVDANISLPQVFRGRGIEVLSMSGHEATQFVFSSSCGPFSVSIASGRTSSGPPMPGNRS
jgi:chemotaxis protein CheX